MAIAVASLFGLVFALLFVAQYPAMIATAWWITSIALLAGVVGTFALATMLGTDIATYQRLELDLARTVIAHLGSNTSPEPEAALGGVWRAYVAVADESRRVARVHAYAFGPFLWGTVISLIAALLTGLGTVTSTANVVGVGLLVEFFGFVLLFLGAAALVLTVGYSDDVPGFHGFAARRWRRNAARLPAVEEALSNVPWLPEFHRGVRESKTDPSDSTLRWISP
ncbi:MAG TPA: hypothetical protein VML53_06795 [Thermoplasmata archaeon]|nr:hypothetical protein [Thermoplasmata archaeon]